MSIHSLGRVPMVLLWVSAVCGMLTPVSTTAAHAAVWFLLAGALAQWGDNARWGRGIRGTSMSSEYCAVKDAQQGLWRASSVWLLCVVVAWLMLWAAAGWWQDRWLYPMRVGRMVPSALAAWVLVRYWRPCAKVRTWVTHALAVLCVLAFFEIYLNGRNTPTNAIPWAVAMSCMVAVLAPRVLDTHEKQGDRLWWLLACVMGVAAVILSMTRGAWGIALWVLLVWFAPKGKNTRFVRMSLVWLTGVVVAVLVLLTSLAGDDWFEKPVQRLQQAITEVVQVVQAPLARDTVETSIGARFHLWRVGVQTFKDSPWIGVGGHELFFLLQREAQRLDSPMLSYASDQLHNEWLQAMVCYGLWGGMALLLIFVGLAGAWYCLGRVRWEARWQLVGIFFVHFTGGLSNVNFSQNYYGLMLGLSVALVLCMAHVDGES